MIVRFLFSLLSIIPALCNARQMYAVQIIPSEIIYNIFNDTKNISKESLPPFQNLIIPIALFNNNNWVMQNGGYLMKSPDITCSAYDQAVCTSLKNFYKPRRSQLIATGLYKYEINRAITFGLNSGFDAPKLNIKPSFMMGHLIKLDLDYSKTESLIIEGLIWFGGRVKHEACIDEYDREYYCPSLTAWSDFTYKRDVNSISFMLLYQKKF